MFYRGAKEMKNRKLISVMTALVLTLVMTAVLAGCGQKDQPAEEQSTQTQTEQPATDDTAAPATDDTAAPATDGSTASDQSGSEYIGEDKALEIALNDAGFTKDQVSNAYAHLDYDDDLGRYEYEVKFYNGTTEYEYDVDAVTGEITDKDIDTDD